jgi:hypothetical protein
MGMNPKGVGRDQKNWKAGMIKAVKDWACKMEGESFRLVDSGLKHRVGNFGGYSLEDDRFSKNSERGTSP